MTSMTSPLVHGEGAGFRLLWPARTPATSRVARFRAASAWGGSRRNARPAGATFNHYRTGEDDDHEDQS
jgi:hypothetical protein